MTEANIIHDGHKLAWRRPLNFSALDPLQVRNWLLLLQEDAISGIRLQPNLHLERGYLGYSFSSNKFGLRGPCSPNAAGAIFGTSFAMGKGVDIGFNWYDGLLKDDWMNFGFPMGVMQTEKLFQHYYTGKAKTAVVLYFHNFWEYTLKFSLWTLSSKPIFQYFGWETDWNKCYLLYKKKSKELLKHVQDGNGLVFNHNNEKYHVNCKYARFDFDAYPSVVEDLLACWKNILDNFNNVVIIRIPQKQELVSLDLENDVLRDSKQNYEKGWLLMKNHFELDAKVRFVEPDHFCLDDYHPWDVHWNYNGNDKFRQIFMKNILS